MTFNSQTEDFASCQTCEDNIDELVKQHFQLENFGVCLSKEDRTKNEEDQRAISIIKNSIKKINNQYEVALPWKEDNPELNNNKAMAIQRLLHLDKKFQQNPTLFLQYEKQINALIDKKYARKISFADINHKKKVWFLPHFPVINPKKNYTNLQNSYSMLLPNSKTRH